MNERIKELTEQARQYAENKQNDPLRVYTLDVFTEKFAELIVRECLAKCDKYAGGGAGSEWDLGAMYSAEAIGDEIREHFGVE